ncbi:MAG TPA: protein kinase, partial [Dongiaceae bacterium]|nr:protein kinase [Dongiaceae bacterium]
MIQVPGYIIKREIGSGGMATVFLAEQQSLEREVALKVMNAQLATDPNFSRRFLQEARTLASLSHPHIVAVYDVGVTDTGLNYFSMQYLSGGDLAGRIRDGITEAELLPILSGVARALGYAHQRGFVHRDVSPANVMFDTGGSPILTDFGIARAVSRGSSRLTNSGVSVGTSYYMSPEQARGGEVDARSDIYSLGATIFESLTGKPPYEGEDGFAIAYAHVFEPIPRLPPKAAHWQGLIDKALAKDPRERYQDMDAFIAALVELGAAAGSPTTTLVMPKLGSSATVAMPVPTAAAAATTSNNGVAATAQERSTVALPIPVTAESAAVDPTAVNEVPTAFHLPSPAAVPARRPGGLPWPALVSVGAGLAVLLAAGFAYWRAQQPSQPVAVPVNAVAAIEAKRQAAKEPVTPATPTSDTTPTGDQVAGPVNESAPETTVTGAGAASPTAGPQSNPEVDVPLRDDLDLPINPEADAAARQQALAMTAIDPLLDQLTKGQSELTRQKPGSPPSTKALDRFRLALKLAQKFRAVPETEKAKQGILAVAQAYADAAEKRLGEGKIDEFLEQNRRAEETARSLPEGS